MEANSKMSVRRPGELSYAGLPRAVPKTEWAEYMTESGLPLASVVAILGGSLPRTDDYEAIAEAAHFLLCIVWSFPRSRRP